LTSEVITSSSKVKPRSQADQIAKPAAASSSRVFDEVDSDGMEIDGRKGVVVCLSFFL
jgi:hypothetical protein